MNALILVDIQNDFLPGGPLAVPEGDAIIPVIHRIQPSFALVVATRDWHPADHGSFADVHPGHKPGDRIDLNGLPQILWPMHCVQGTPGAEFAASLNTDRIERMFDKGLDPTVDSYSGFFDNGHRHSTGLDEYLRGRGVKRVAVCGLATDYCVKFTALDAAACGFEVTLVRDACRGVELQHGDVEAAIAEMAAAGIRVVDSAALCRGHS